MTTIIAEMPVQFVFPIVQRWRTHIWGINIKQGSADVGRWCHYNALFTRICICSLHCSVALHHLLISIGRDINLFLYHDAHAYISGPQFRQKPNGRPALGGSNDPSALSLTHGSGMAWPGVVCRASVPYNHLVSFSKCCSHYLVNTMSCIVNRSKIKYSLRWSHIVNRSYTGSQALANDIIANVDSGSTLTRYKLLKLQ
jgi:hypothetical protein